MNILKNRIYAIFNLIKKRVPKILSLVRYCGAWRGLFANDCKKH